MRQRLINPDFIRGICIILMVYGHITHIGNYSNYQKEVVGIIYTFHMPLFLIISGYFFNISKTFNEHFKTIIKKIGIPYVFFITLYLIGLLLIGKIGIQTSNTPPNNLLQFLENIFLHPKGAYWFLHALLIINIVFIFVNQLVNRIGKGSVFMYYIFLFIIFIMLDILGLIKIRTSTYFILGFILKQLTSYNIKVTPFSIFIFIPVCVFLYMQQSAFEFSPIEVTNCFLIFSCLWIFSDYFVNSKFVTIISWIGQNTLIILLLHALFVVAFKPFNSIFLSIDSTGIFYSIFGTITTVLLCILTSRGFDKLKISKYLFNVHELFISIKANKRP